MEFIHLLPFVAIVGILGLMISVYLGLALAPFSAITCALLARRRGLSAKRHALAGGIFSVLLVGPSVYLILRLLNKRPPASLINLFYLAVFILWFLGPILFPFSFVLLEIQYPSPDSVHRVFMIATQGITVIVNTTALIVWVVWWRHRKPTPEDDASVLPRIGYVLPFFMAPFGLVVLWALGYVEEWLRVA